MRDEACSTPFGVMDGFTARVDKALNGASTCAQRLSASWMVSLPASILDCPRRFCAQRLSASWMVSLDRVLGLASGGTCSTPFGVMDGFT